MDEKKLNALDEEKLKEINGGAISEGVGWCYTMSYTAGGEGKEISSGPFATKEEAETQYKSLKTLVEALGAKVTNVVYFYKDDPLSTDIHFI